MEIEYAERLCGLMEEEVEELGDFEEVEVIKEVEEMDESTVEMPPPPPLPRLLPLPKNNPFPIPLPPLPPIPSLCNPSPQRRSPGERPTTRSHSTGEKSDSHGRNGVRTIMVLNKTPMVRIHSTNGS